MIRSDSTKEVIVLVHGLMRSHKSMYRPSEYIRRHDYEIYLYHYPSTQYKIDKFITHSLGGIITREALGLLSSEKLRQCHSLIMLSPPNQGSPLARLLVKWFPFIARVIKPLNELSCSQEAYMHRGVICIH